MHSIQNINVWDTKVELGVVRKKNIALKWYCV